jgi:hypothetical protein
MASIRKARRRVARWERYTARCMRVAGEQHLAVPHGEDRARDALQAALRCHNSCRCDGCTLWRRTAGAV